MSHEWILNKNSDSKIKVTDQIFETVNLTDSNMVRQFNGSKSKWFLNLRYQIFRPVIFTVPVNRLHYKKSTWSKNNDSHDSSDNLVNQSHDSSDNLVTTNCVESAHAFMMKKKKSRALNLLQNTLHVAMIPSWGKDQKISAKPNLTH